jgi:hypothetical protein
MLKLSSLACCAKRNFVIFKCTGTVKHRKLRLAGRISEIWETVNAYIILGGGGPLIECPLGCCEEDGSIIFKMDTRFQTFVAVQFYYIWAITSCKYMLCNRCFGKFCLHNVIFILKMQITTRMCKTLAVQPTSTYGYPPETSSTLA